MPPASPSPISLSLPPNPISIPPLSTTHAGLWSAVELLSPEHRFLALALPAIGQAHVLALAPEGAETAAAAAATDGGRGAVAATAAAAAAWLPSLEALCASLARVEAFYDSMGGLVGYQLASVRLVVEGTAALEQQQQEQQQEEQQQRSGSAAPPRADRAAHASAAAAAPATTTTTTTFHVPPPTLHLAAGTPEAEAAGARAVAAGVRATPFLAEIWPVGGAGDRLGLRCEATGEPLPAAMLPYAGRPILEALVRDLQAREHLHWRLTGAQCVTPLAVMTSDAKGNDRRIRALFEGAGWYGRGRDTVRLVRQPLVPVLDASDGTWLLSGPCAPAMKPGGHGAIWKLLRDEGVFSWLEQKGRSAALVRQISNPMAGTDTTLLALAGAGHAGGKEFGFMSCERVVGAAEGMNVLRRQRRSKRRALGRAAGGGAGAADADAADADAADADAPSSLPLSPEEGQDEDEEEYVMTNVEYTEFEKLGMSDRPLEAGSATSAFPANTNILYVGLEAARRAVDEAVAAGGGDVLPGLIFNLKKKVAYADPLRGGEVRQVRAGRMESTMQNLADQLGTRVVVAGANGSVGGGAGAAAADESGGASPSPPPASLSALAPGLSTFLVRNARRKVTSSAKKRRDPAAPPGHGLHQTPDGSFLDLQANARELLLTKCGLRYVPPVGDAARYLARGPGFVCLLHPALGPLWDVIAQKVRGGAIMDGSELVLEVAEARLRDVTVEGSLLVSSDAPLGHTVFGGAGGGAGLAAAEAGERGAAAASPRPAPSSSCSSFSGGQGQQPQQQPQRPNEQQEQQEQQPKQAQQPPQEQQDPGRLVFSSRCGRASLSRVEVRNVGVDWRHPSNEPWRHRLVRHESCRVVLRGCAEFEAFDCRITGDALFEVPDGHRMVVTQAPTAGGGAQAQAPAAAKAGVGGNANGAAAASGGASSGAPSSPSSSASVFQVGDLLVVLEPLRRSEADGSPVPSWEWRYAMDQGGAVRLEYRRNVPLAPWVLSASASAAAAASAAPLAAAAPSAAAPSAAAALSGGVPPDPAAAAAAAEAAALGLDPGLAGAMAAEASAAWAGAQAAASPDGAAALARAATGEGGGAGLASPASSSSGSGASAATMYMQHDEVRTVPHYSI